MASSVEMLSGRRKKDYEAEASADAFAAQASRAAAADGSDGTPDPAEPIADEAMAIA